MHTPEDHLHHDIHYNHPGRLYPHLHYGDEHNHCIRPRADNDVNGLFLCQWELDRVNLELRPADSDVALGRHNHYHCLILCSQCDMDLVGAV